MPPPPGVAFAAAVVVLASSFLFLSSFLSPFFFFLSLHSLTHSLIAVDCAEDQREMETYFLLTSVLSLSQVVCGHLLTSSAHAVVSECPSP